MSRPGNNDFKEYSYDPYQAFLDDNEAYDSSAPNEKLSSHLQKHIQTNQELGYDFGGPRAHYPSLDEPITPAPIYPDSPTMDSFFGNGRFSSSPPVPEQPSGSVETESLFPNHQPALHTQLPSQPSLDQDVGTYKVPQKSHSRQTNTYMKARPLSPEPMSPLRVASHFHTDAEYQEYRKQRKQKGHRNRYRKARVERWEKEMNRKATGGRT
jgi:hypothetical protein